LTVTDIDALAAQLQAEKIEEAQATARRIATEQRLVELVGHKEEGDQRTMGREWKVITTGVINRKFDEAALDAIRPSIPAALFEQCVRYKPEPITAGLRYLRNNEPETYAVLAQALTATPGKTGVRVEFVGAQREAA
jgi:hypothetical protein